MGHFLFEELLTGDEFLVYANNYDTATEIAESLWDDYHTSKVVFRYEMTDEEADESGLDEF